MSGGSAESGNSALFQNVVASFPEAAACVEAVNDRLISEYGWHCSDEEKLYLILHINRLYGDAASRTGR